MKIKLGALLRAIRNTSDTLFQAYWVVTPADGEDYFGEKTT